MASIIIIFIFIFIFISFNGTLLLSDPDTGLSWSSSPNLVGAAAIGGHKLVILTSSNLQILDNNGLPIWESFHFPSDTLVQNQNFTSQSTLLVSGNYYNKNVYSMSLGPTYMALYTEQRYSRPIMYWKHSALQAKALIIPGAGPIYARLDPTGFLGLYQNETALVDVQPFDTFNQGIKSPSLSRLTLDSDGNLRAYYWSASSSTWVLDFQAITETCNLPAPCGPYATCQYSSQGQMLCGCLQDNHTTVHDTRCFPVAAAASGDLCGLDSDDYRVVRRSGVDLANKELLGFQKVGSLEQCEGLCASNCTCWGAVYNNASGFCYQMDYPIQTVLAVGDEHKLGYFKVENGEVHKRKRLGLLLIITGLLVLAGGCGFAGYRVWTGRRWRSAAGSNEEQVVIMPYKDLNSSSFRSIEMFSNSFTKS